jgi:hypothetical protein
MQSGQLSCRAPHERRGVRRRLSQFPYRFIPRVPASRTRLPINRPTALIPEVRPASGNDPVVV